MYFKTHFENNFYNRHHRRVIQSRIARGATWVENELVGGEKKRKGFTRR